MKVRSFILISLVPIFVGLAAANAATLWFANSRELNTDLEEQARAAAVSTAEYLSARPELAQRLATGPGSAALTLAMAQIEGLKGIYLLDAQGRCCVLRAGRNPEHLPVRPAVEMAPQLGAIERLSTGEHSLTAAVRLRDGETLWIDLDADRLLSARKALRDRVVAMLVAGLLAGILVALLVAGWLTGDIRRLQRLLSGGQEADEDFAPRFMETQDTAEAILMLQDNLKTGAALRKRRMLIAEETRDRVSAVRSQARKQVGECLVKLHGFELAVGTISQLEPGETIAIVEAAEFAACVMIRVCGADVAQTYATAALVRARLEHFESQNAFANDLELIGGLFPIEMVALAWAPGLATAILIEVMAGACRCRSVELAEGEARLFHLGSGYTARSFDQFSWVSASERLRAARNLSEAHGLAMCLMPTASQSTCLAA